MRKRLLSICLVLCMMLALVPQMEIEAEAAESWLWPSNYTREWQTYIDHAGIDIVQPLNIDVLASKSGTLYISNNTCNGKHAVDGSNIPLSPSLGGCTVSDCKSGTGKCVYIIHGDGSASCYMHLNSITVSSGSYVKQGQVIGKTGTTGPSTGYHLHFEVAYSSNATLTNYWNYTRFEYDRDSKKLAYSNPNYFPISYIYEASSTTPPKAILSIDRTYYNVGDTVTFTLGDSTATGFYIGIYKDGERIDGLGVGSTYTRVFDEPGSYSAYMSASNSAGYTDSNWVYWEVAEPNYLERSTYYPSYLKVKTTANTQLRTLPDSGSELVLTLSKGEVETVTGLYYNPDYEFWYRMEYNGQTCYMYAGHAEVTEFLQGTSIRDVVAPTALSVGQSFTLEGVISTEYTQLFQAAAAVETGTETLLHAWERTTANPYSLENSNVDHGISLGSLSEGYYTYIVYVGECSYYWDGDSLESKDIWPAVWRSSFTVGSPADSTPGKPALKNMQSVYEEGETVVFDWNTTANTTHYNLYLEKEDSNGTYNRIETNFYAKPTVSRTFTAGNYRAWLQATNSSALTSDGSTWAYTDADLVYFRVGCKHSYESVVTEPTCTEGGYTTYICSECGDSYIGNETATLGHFWDEGVETLAPTCISDGEMTFTCSSCGETYTENVPSLGHRYNDTITAPTCTAGGYTTHSCTFCGDSYIDNETEALGHDYVDNVCTRCGNTMEHSWDEGVETLAPTCISDGEMTFICSSCGETYTENVPSLGHSYNDTITDPTCTAGGYTTYTCLRCGDVQVLHKKPALGHEYVSGICTRCGDTIKDPVITDAYELEEIQLVSETGEILSSIPNRSFWAAVTLTKKAEVTDGYVYIAAYTENGQFIRMFAMWAGIPVGTTTELCVLLDHSGGEISEVRAFVVDSLVGGSPLAQSVSAK